jgi:hypothetical protein
MRTTTVDRGGVPGHFARESSAKFASSPGNDAGGSDIPTGPNDTCELLTRWHPDRPERHLRIADPLAPRRVHAARRW